MYCNCDDPRVSNFFHYFSHNFEHLGLKRLITTCYKSKDIEDFSQGTAQQAVWLEYMGDKNGNRVPDPAEIGIHPLQGDGDFRSAECIDLLRQADIVVTNPPFSLFREYVHQLVENRKQFLIVGSQNGVTTKDIFELIGTNQIWLGNNSGDMAFRVPSHYEPRETRFWIDENGQKWRSLGNACWFTNMDYKERHEDLILYKTYSPAAYPHYDNYDAIDASKTSEIPKDYFGLIGVPITFLDRHNPDQFEIIGIAKTWFGMAIKTYPKQIQVDGKARKEVSKLNDQPAILVPNPPVSGTYYEVEGKYYTTKYVRLLIRRKVVKP